MKFIKSIALALACTFATASYSMGVEEFCQESVQVDIRFKNVLKEDPSFLRDALALADKSEVSPKSRQKFRERIYFVYNRRHLSDKDLEQLAFINCLVTYK